MPQLRSLFLTGEEVRKDMGRFISERVGAILSNDTFFELDLTKGVFILHILPIQSFEEDIFIPTSKMKESKTFLVPIAHRNGYLEEVNNFEGFNRFSKDGIFVEAYAQAFSSGVIECVNTWMLSVPSPMGPYIDADNFAHGAFSGLHALTKYLDSLGVSLPFILQLELHGIKNIQLSTGYDNARMLTSQKRLRNDSLRFPSIFEMNPDALTKPNFFVREIKIWMDLLWRAFGYTECLSYTDAGYQFRNPKDGFSAFEE